MVNIPTIELALKQGLTHCPICKSSFVMTSKQHKRSPTRDHILPKCRYTNETIEIFKDPNSYNIKIICNKCNCKRSDYNHCIAAFILYKVTKGDMRFYDGNRTNPDQECRKVS